MLGEGGVTWGMSNRMENESKKERGEESFGPRCLWLWLLLALQKLGGFAEYGITPNVEGAPMDGERKHRGGEPPVVPRGVALALSRLTQAS